ncbi:MAG: DUF2807 domain-containing protein [Chitinophagales bacterium]
MIHRSIFSLVFLACLLFISCKRTVQGSGEIITDDRITRNFEMVEMRGVAKIEITKSAEYKVTLQGHENIIHLIETNVKNGKLTISSGKDVNITNSEITIHISTPVLDEVILSGAGELVINGYHQSKMRIKLQGAGNVRFSNSECDTVYAALNGAGNMYVNAKSYLEANLNGVGNIEYAGDPTVKSKVSGMGNVSKK